MDFGERLSALMDNKRLNKRQLSKITGYSDVQAGKIADGKAEPKLGFIIGILTTFPDVNQRWLILGEGEMYQEVKRVSISDYKTTEIIRHIDKNRSEFFKDEDFVWLLNQANKERLLDETLEDTLKKRLELVKTLKDIEDKGAN